MTVRRPKSRLVLTIIGTLAITSGLSVAETVQIPRTEGAATTGSTPWNVPIPARGITKTQVEQQFGSPQSKQGPTGEPPIYFWEYPEYTVYFEAEHVIHTVRKYQPQ